MTLARVDSAKSCATPRDTTVSSPIATSTSTRLNPRLLELNLAGIVNRHCLRFAITRDGHGNRRRDYRGHAVDHLRGCSVRAELNDRIAHPRAVGQRPHRAIKVRPRDDVGIGWWKR